MSIRTVYSQISASLGVNFYYGRKSDFNIQGDNATFPAIVLIEPDDIGFTINMTTGNVYNADNTFVQFLDKRVMGQQASDREEVVDAMRLLAARFVLEVAGSTDLSINSTNNEISVRGVLVVDAYDANVAGIEINLPVKPIQPNAICAI